LEASQQFSFLQGRVVTPRPTPSRRTRPLYLYPPEAGWLPILVASYYTHGLRWDYSYFPVTTRKFRYSTQKYIVTTSFHFVPDVTFMLRCLAVGWRKLHEEEVHNFLG
jgi:hypothetical protein